MTDTSPDSLDPLDDPELNRLVEEYLSRARLGEGLSYETFAAQFPEHETLLLEVLPTIDLIQRAKDRSDDGHQDTPAQLGDFRILGELGRGGMGVVYRARQISLDRSVALKVVAAHRLADEHARQRFEREARTVASLEHPNVVPVYSVGEADGVHYMAMKLIDGMSLSEVIVAEQQDRGIWEASSTAPQGERGPSVGPRAGTDASADVAGGSTSGFASTVVMPDERDGDADEEGPSGVAHDRSSSSATSTSLTRSATTTRARQIARVFRDVARAIESAHAVGVLHRDIKPGNLLLDETGKVWVTDFGLAKGETNEALTETGSLLGTPKYMAPEAIQGWADRRTDVYGIGVTLYEVLTGAPAFDGASRAELLRNIEERDPIRPRKRDSRIPRDLETIVLTAMDRVPERRYATADELAADLDRFLHGQPIVARAATVAYRMTLFAQRHAVAVSAAACVLVLFLAMALGWTLSLDKERDAALVAKDLAQRNSVRAVQAVEQLLTRIGNERLRDEPGFSELRRELLQDARDFYVEILSERSDDPTLHSETVRAYLRLGLVQEQLGNAGEAEASYREAIALSGQLASTQEDHPRSVALEAASLMRLGSLLRQAGQYEEAKKLIGRGMQLLDAVPVAGHDADEPPTITMLLLEAMLEIGRVQGRTWAAEAESTINKLLSRTEEALRYWPEDYMLQRMQLYGSYEKACLIGQGQRREEAVELFRWTRDRHRQRKTSPGANLRSEWRSELFCDLQLLVLLEALGRDDELAATVDQSVASARSLAERFPRQTSIQALLARVLRAGASTRRKMRDLDSAMALLEESIEIQKKCIAKAPSIVQHRRDLASSLRSVGAIYRDREKYGDAEAAYRQALEIYERLAADAPGSNSWFAYLYETHGRLGGILKQNPERIEEAVGHYRAALENIEKLAERNATFVTRFRHAKAIGNLGGVLRIAGRFEEAIAALDRAREACEALLKEAPKDSRPVSELVVIQRRLGMTRTALEDATGAVAHYAAVADLSKKLAERNPKSTRLRDAHFDAVYSWGVALEKADDHSRAATVYKEAIELAQAAVRVNPKRSSSWSRLSHASARAAVASYQSGNVDEAISALNVVAAESPPTPAIYESTGLTAAKLARVVGPDHESHGRFVKASAKSLRAAVEHGSSIDTLRDDETLQELRLHPDLQWIFVD